MSQSFLTSKMTFGHDVGKILRRRGANEDSFELSSFKGSLVPVDIRCLWSSEDCWKVGDDEL